MTGKKHGDPLAGAVRRVCNNDWSQDPVSPRDAQVRVAERYLASFERESGSRVFVECCLPVGVNPADGGDVLYDLERELSRIAGGWTSHEGRGGWRGPDGVEMIERIYVYKVSVITQPEAKLCVAAFITAGRQLGQEWTHITSGIEYAEHTKTRRE